MNLLLTILTVPNLINDYMLYSFPLSLLKNYQKVNYLHTLKFFKHSGISKTIKLSSGALLEK